MKVWSIGFFVSELLYLGNLGICAVADMIDDPGAFTPFMRAGIFGLCFLLVLHLFYQQYSLGKVIASKDKLVQELNDKMACLLEEDMASRDRLSRAMDKYEAMVTNLLAATQAKEKGGTNEQDT